MGPAMSLMRPVPGQPLEVFRRSRIQNLLTCEGFELEDSELLAFGRAVHDFIYRWTALAVELGGEPPRQQALRLAEQAWVAADGLDWNRSQEFTWLAERFLDSHLPNLERLQAYEYPLVQDLDGIRYTATLDRIESIEGYGDPLDPDPAALLVIDYKSERGRRDHRFQQLFYLCLLILEPRWREAEHFEFQIDPLRERALPRRLLVERKDFEEGWLGNWFRLVRERLRRVREEPSGELRGGEHCFECRRRVECGAALREASLTPGSLEEAEALYREAKRLYAAADSRWKPLKVFMEGKGTLYVDGKHVAWMTPEHPSFRLLKPVDEVVEFLRWRGVEVPGADLRLPLDSETLSNPGTRRLLVEEGYAEYWSGPSQFKERVAPPQEFEQ